MTKYQNVDGALGKLHTTLRNNPSTNDIIIPSHIKNRKDLQKLLEILTTSNDINLQIKLFIILSACSLSDDKNLTIIIKFKALYNKISNVLETGLPGKAVHALNFLYSLLRIEVEDDTPTRRKLAQYVKDKVRTTGCLGIMMNKFNSVMYIDTWNALCQCIAAACNNCDTNQTYCSLLIPLCIQKCSSTNKNVFIVLQNILRNHNANMQMFVECNGFSIFTRELLQYDKCMQLLRIVAVQYPDAPELLVRQNLVLNNLREFVRIYGCGSEIGHKATIILHHVESRVTDPNSGNISNINPNKNIPPNKMQTENKYANKQKTRAVVDLDDTAILMQNIAKEVSKFNHFNLNEARGNVRSKANNPELNNIFTVENQNINKFVQGKGPDIRTEPKQKEMHSNIAHESLLHRHNQLRIRAQRKMITRKSSFTVKGNLRRHGPKQLHRNISIEPSFSFLENQNKEQRKNMKSPSVEPSLSFLEETNPQYNDVRSQISHSSMSDAPSFPFLENMNNQQQSNISREPTNKKRESFDKNGGNGRKHKQQESPSSNVSVEPSFSFLENQNNKPVNKKSRTKMETKNLYTVEENIPNMCKHHSKSSTPASDVFDPVFSSTFVEERTKRKDSGNSTQSKTAKRRCVENRSISREPENVANMSLRNTSIGSRILDVMNNSCTSFVQSVTSIFRKKKTNDSFRASVSPKNDTSYSFSFVKCVDKQDALNSNLQRKRRNDSLFSNGSSSCDTCDDTQELRKKLRNDKNLKQTVKKLKMGINMFGCDFKKISRTMWPRDTYMKPEVLYKLYRKLLAK